MNMVKKLCGWRRNSVAFLLGVCATLTLAPFYFFPLIVPAYGGLFLLAENAASRKRAFADGWWWGWGFFISGLYWFCIALLTDAEKFAWAIPFALFGLNAVIALYPATACLFFFIIKSRVRVLTSYSFLTFSFIWLFVEYARGHLFSGFPWNIAGYSFGFSDVSLQSAYLLGAYGLTFFTVLLAVSAVVIRSNRFFASFIWGVFALSLIWGDLRLSQVTADDANDNRVMIRLVQANIMQHHKWDPMLQRQHLEDYLSLTNSKGIDKISYVVWPETAVPYAMRSLTPLSEYIGSNLPEGVTLITGALRVEGEGLNDDAKFYNSVVVLNNAGEIIGNYDKRALVPFGEFLPLRFLIPKNLKLPVGDKDFSSGNGDRKLAVQGLPEAGVLICYEAIFPELSVFPNEKPKWLLNVTNDAWFGMSSGPYQHFEMARMRAVEQKLPLVRVANTGITAYIDEYGRVKDRIGLGKKGFIDIKL